MNRKFLFVLLSIFWTINVINAGDFSYLYKDLPFDMPVLKKPTFPDNTVNIIDFEGMPDGVTLNTKAFAKAMNALAAEGGGTLLVPSGVWYTGPIVFQLEK